MVKRLLMVAALCSIALGSLFADVDIDLALAAKTGMGIEMSKPAEGSFNTRIEAELESMIGLYFDGNKSGIDVLFGTDFKQKFTLGAGYTYKTAIDTTSDFVMAIGPYCIFGSGCDVGVYARAEANLIIAKNFFVKAGTGVNVEFLQFGKDGTSLDLSVSIPLPRIAFGWTM